MSIIIPNRSVFFAEKIGTQSTPNFSNLVKLVESLVNGKSPTTKFHWCNLISTVNRPHSSFSIFCLKARLLGIMGAFL